MILSLDDAAQDALDAAKAALKRSGIREPTDLQAAVLLVTHLAAMFGPDALKRAYFVGRTSN